MDIKSYFHAWCNRLGKTPSFNVISTGPKHRQIFLCKLKVEGYEYTGSGHSTTKKDAQFSAAKDFLLYLVGNNFLKATEVPSEIFLKDDQNESGLSGPAKEVCQPVPPQQVFQPEPPKQVSQPVSARPVFQPGMRPDLMGEAYRPYQLEKVNFSQPYMVEDAGQNKLKETKEIDVNAAIHGNWTIENGKSRLHQFLQQYNIKTDYKYSIIGEGGCRSFVAEMTIYDKKLNRSITGRESGLNKAAASKSCALSLVRQLYHLGIIEPFSGTLKKNREKENEIKPYVVALSPELEQQILDVLCFANIKPTLIPRKELPPDQTMTIINTTVSEKFISLKPLRANVVLWAPPTENWNPWTSAAIEDGSSPNASLKEISQSLKEKYFCRLKDENMKKILKEREMLPVATEKSKILRAIQENPVIIIRGPTGCGKTNQICQFILDDYIQCDQGAYCNIVITQPRRILAISVAEKIAHERMEQVGNSVGYHVRFDSCLPRPYGSILLCTVGVLLKRMENGLRGVSHVIVDEIHQRDVNTDFILIVLRDMVHTYPNLKVILMSATIDATMFSKYFGHCPIVEIHGRSFPVREYFLEDCIQMMKFMPKIENRKRKIKNSSKDDDDEDEISIAQMNDDLEGNLNQVISDQYDEETKIAMSRISEKMISFELIEELLKYIRNINVPGAVLIFLPGWNIIFALMRHLQQHPYFGNGNYVFVPLHSRLGRGEQFRVFQNFPENITKIILSTNLAESSITINDVIYVIDSCKTKIKIFTSHNNTTQYATVWASKTNLEQRKGRAGRVRPGLCFRLCSKARYEHLDEHLTPEIFRTPLHELALAVKILQLGSFVQFMSKALEPPPIDSVIEAEVLLREMNCLDSNAELTPLGRILGRLSIDPRLGKMVILSCLMFCGDAMTTVAASSSVFPEVFVQTPDKRRLAHLQRIFSGCRFSDHITMLNAFRCWELTRVNIPEFEEQFCESKMLSLAVLRETREAKNQIINVLTNVSGFPKEIVAYQNYDFNGPDPRVDVLVALLCLGFYPNVAYHQSKRKILTVGRKVAAINKTSVNCSNFEQNFPIPFFVYGEKVRNRIVTCKQMTMISPIHLLLFGARKVEYVNKLIKLDDWLLLDMKPNTASAIVALRPLIENLINKASKMPEMLLEISETDGKIINLVKQLCQIDAGRFGMEPFNWRRFERSKKPRETWGNLGRTEPPRKMPNTSMENRNFGLAHSGNFNGNFNRNFKGSIRQSWRGGRGRGGFRGYQARGRFFKNHVPSERTSIFQNLK